MNNKCGASHKIKEEDGVDKRRLEKYSQKNKFKLGHLKITKTLLYRKKKLLLLLITMRKTNTTTWVDF